jgi:hypothetical protein
VTLGRGCNIVVNSVLQNIEKQSKNVVRSTLLKMFKRFLCVVAGLPVVNKAGSPTPQLRCSVVSAEMLQHRFLTLFVLSRCECRGSS